jgi:type II secretion system protein J
VTSRRRAFTLIEVMVAGIITAMVLGSISMTLSQLGKAKSVAKERLDTFLRADMALNTIRNDVVSIIRADDLFYTRLLLYDDLVGSPAGDLDRDELLVFNTRLRPVRNIDNFNGEGQEYETQFRVEEDDAGAALWQRRDTMPDEYPLGGGMITPMVEGIIGLRIEAYDGNQWFEEWDSDIRGLPHAVLIEVTASGYRNAEEMYDTAIATLRTVVAIDRVLPPRDIFDAEEQERIDQEREENQAAGGTGGDGTGGAADDGTGSSGDGGSGGGGTGGGGTGGSGGSSPGSPGSGILDNTAPDE